MKISDLGLSKFVDQTMLKTFCGTRAYLAPEILEAAWGSQKYTQKVDMWALGVILYELLFGKKPFSEERKTSSSLSEQILTADYVFPSKAEEVSREALDLIQKLLTVEPAQRLSSRELLGHAWLKVNIEWSSSNILLSLLSSNPLSDPAKPRRGLPRRLRTPSRSEKSKVSSSLISTLHCIALPPLIFVLISNKHPKK